GAVSGNPSLVAETLRVTCRYDHFELLKRLGLDTSKLEEFAGKTYPIDKITGNFKAKTDRAKSMEKALSIIQFKLEEKTIRNHPEYKMEDRLWLEKLSNLLQAKTTDNLLDTHFPTLDPKNPARLTDQENEIISDLTHQFVTNRHLKRLLNFFFDKGETYHIHNNILNIHALIPSTENGDFDKFLGKKGKELLDWIQATIDRIGLAYLNNQPQKEADQSLMFYLWCGPKSPFFGKVAMKTFERYFIKDKKTHLEPSLFWNQNLKTKRFKDKIMNEFGTKRVIYGHTPVDVTKGKTMASEDGVAINIDGGFAAAYYNRGHALVHTPHQLYGIILPTPDEVEKAKLTSETVPLSVELIDEFSEPIKIKDTFKGRKMTKEADELLEKLRRLQHKYLSQPHHH
ncbi:MAG: fructose-1,6-bisphosphatase, partial [Deltaproteobacteria bacterium]|nr:fructose-1,6-bisphosphatase [Deltaproteobacteria bacterium]